MVIHKFKLPLSIGSNSIVLSMTSGSKISFVLRPGDGNTLELAQIKRVPVVSPSPEVHRRISKSWKGKLMKKFKKKEEINEDDLEVYKELKLKTSTFRTYPFISLYILAILRFFIFLYSTYLLIELTKNFYNIINEFAGEKVDKMLKEHEFFMKSFGTLLIASIDGDRCLMVTGLGILLPMLAINYGYLIGFFITFYTVTFYKSTDNLEKFIWIDYCKKKELGNKRKSFFINRLESCSTRFDCVLGYALTLPVMNFLFIFNFKTAPHVSIFSGFILIFLILIDELLTIKRKFEIEVILKLLKMYTIIGLIGLSWIFFIRFVTTEYLMEKISTNLSEDLGIGIFICVIIFTVHAVGCAAKFVIRMVKPFDHKITSIPNFKNENFV